MAKRPKADGGKEKPNAALDDTLQRVCTGSGGLRGQRTALCTTVQRFEKVTGASLGFQEHNPLGDVHGCDICTLAGAQAQRPPSQQPQTAPC